MKPKIVLGITILILATTIVLSIVTVIAFEQPAKAATTSMSMFRYQGPRASMAVSENNIYLTWWDNKTGNNEVFFAGSNDSGKSFGKPINLSNDKGGSADSQITASQNNVFVTWWDNKTGSWEVFSRASADGGKTFGEAGMLKSVGTSPLKTLTAPPSSQISVDTLVAASGSNNEYVAWWDNKTGNLEVDFAKSTDGGKTFGDTINISNSPDSRSVGARIVAQGNNVYISWMEIKPGEKDVMFRASNDNGGTFGNPVMVNK